MSRNFFFFYEETNKNKNKKKRRKGRTKASWERNKIEFSYKRDLLKEMDRAKQPSQEVRKRRLRLPCRCAITTVQFT